MRCVIAVLLTCGSLHAAAEPADLILHNGRIITVDQTFQIVQAVAVKDGRILDAGKNERIRTHEGPKTRVIDLNGKTVLPGLYDSHTHPLGAATSELRAPLPVLKSLKDVFAHIAARAAKTPEGEWIVIQYAFPTRLDEMRFPTKSELDRAAPKHPVLYHAGPAGVANSLALKLSGVSKDTPNPPAGVIVKDSNGEPTGLLRNAYGVLRGVPGESGRISPEQKREAVKKLFQLYNEQGLTSIADRSAGREALDLYLDLQKRGELTLRVNVARNFGTSGTREQIVKRLEDLPGKDKRGGPTGVGDEWVRIGPIKLFLDGGMLNGTAYMRQPWPKGDTYQITEDGYRGLLFVKPEQLTMVLEEGAKKKWQMTAHCAGEGGMDVLLDAYELVNRMTPIKPMRWCITHANFPSRNNLERCQRLGVCADVQPAWLWKDGATLAKVLDEPRMRWFQPYNSWLRYTTIGGGSDHMIKLDSLEATNPWNPWLGIYVAVTRATERGRALNSNEALTRKQAIKLYTINNAYLHNEEKEKGSIEPGKLADMIAIDRDIMSCPTDAIRGTKVLTTIVAGKVVFERAK
jgi:predicted amidohydrolase YtcJ